MNIPIPRRYFLIPVVYIALISALVAMEFTGTVKIEERVNNLSVTALVPARRGGDPQILRRLDITTDGFHLSFSRQEPLEFRLSSGRSVYAYLSGYAVLPGSVEIDFGDRLRLIIQTGNKAGGTDRNRVAIETDLLEEATLLLPFLYADGFSVDQFAGLPLLSLSKTYKRGQTITAISLPADSTIDLRNGEKKGTIILRNSTGGFSSFYVTRLDKPGPEVVSHWFQTQYRYPGSDEYNAIVENYVETAFLGWTYTRYSRTSGTWRMPDATQSFDENILSAALTEAVRRGTTSETADRFREGIQRHAEETTWISAPHLGDIVDKGENIGEGDIDRIRNIETMISEEDLSLFSSPDLLSFIADRAPTPLFQDLAEFAARVDIEEIEARYAPGLLNLYLESREIEDPLSAAFDGFDSAVEASIFPAIWLTDQGYFLGSNNGSIDILTSVRAGAAVARIGVYQANPFYEAIGLELIASVLSLSGSEGFLPAVLRMDGRTVIGSSGYIKPEEIYPLISGDTYYPHYVSLSNALGSRGWAWTAAEEFQGRQNGSSIELSFTYPVDESHHMIINGIEPFSFITLFGIRWKSDPRFQFYGSGWFYDEGRKTLFVKITHSQEMEEIVISYE